MGLFKLYVKSFNDVLYENDINLIQATCGIMKFDTTDNKFKPEDTYTYNILTTWHGDKNHRKMYPRDKDTAEAVFVLSAFTGNYEMPQTIKIDVTDIEELKLPLCIITSIFNITLPGNNIISNIPIKYEKDGVILDFTALTGEFLLCVEQYTYVNVLSNIVKDNTITVSGKYLIHGIVDSTTGELLREYESVKFIKNNTIIKFVDNFDKIGSKLLLSNYTEMKLKDIRLPQNHVHIIDTTYDIPGWWKLTNKNCVNELTQIYNKVNNKLEIILPTVNERNMKVFLPKWTERLMHNYSNLEPLSNKQLLSGEGGTEDTIIINKGTNLAREIILDDLDTLEAQNAQKAFEILSYKELEGYHIIDANPSMVRDEIQELINKQARDVNGKCIALYLETGDYYFNKPLEFSNFKNGKIQILGKPGDEHTEEKHVKIHHTTDFIPETTEISAALLQQQRALIMVWGCEYFYMARIQIEVRPADLNTYFDYLCGVYISNIQFGLILYNHINCDKNYNGWAAAVKAEQGQYNISQNYIGGFRFGIDTSHVGVLKAHANNAPTDTRFDTNWYNLHSTGGFMIYPPSSNNMKYSIADCVANTGFIVNKNSCILT